MAQSASCCAEAAQALNAASFDIVVLDVMLAGWIGALAPTDLESGKARATAALDHLAELVEVLLWFARARNHSIGRG